MNSSNTRTGRSALGRWGLVCAVGAVLASPALGQRGERSNDVNVTDYGTVDLAVQDTDLSQVLQMLSIQSRKNIITSKSVSATVGPVNSEAIAETTRRWLFIDNSLDRTGSRLRG